MLFKLFTVLQCLVLISVECANVPEGDANPKEKVLVKLDPNQVVDAFKSVVSSEYLRKLAHSLALRAAERFLTLMKGKQKKPEETINIDFRRPPVHQYSRLSEEDDPSANNEAMMKAAVVEEIERMPETNNEPIPSELNIDVKQAMTLLREPSPDGDNLDLISPNLSDDEEVNKTKPPVIQLMKVNGKYVRRLLFI